MSFLSKIFIQKQYIRPKNLLKKNFNRKILFIFYENIKVLCAIFTSLLFMNYYLIASQMTCYETLLITDNNETISSVKNQFLINYKQDGIMYKNFEIEGIDCPFIQVKSFDTDYIKLICDSYASEEDIVSETITRSTISISRYTGDLIRIYSNTDDKNEINFKGKCKKSQ